MVGITCGGGGTELLAQRYQRGGSYLSTVAVPLLQLAEVLPVPDPDLPYEGNRRVSLAHAREFADYWRENTRWAVPPLLADTARSLAEGFEPMAEEDGLVAGVLRLPQPAASGLHILDGQHRVLGWSLLRLEPGDHQIRLRDEAVTVEILEHVELAEHKQYFFDIAAHAKGTTRSLSAGFDKRAPLNRAAIRLASEHPLLAARVDMENDRVGNRRSALVSLQNVVDLVTAANAGINGWVTQARRATLTEESASRVATRALDAMCWAFDDLADVVEGALTPMELRETSLLGSVSMLRVLAASYHDLAVRNGDVVEAGDAHARALFTVLNEHMRLPIDDLWWYSEVFGRRDAKGPHARRQDLRSLIQYIGYIAAKVHPVPPAQPSVRPPRPDVVTEAPTLAAKLEAHDESAPPAEGRTSAAAEPEAWAADPDAAAVEPAAAPVREGPGPAEADVGPEEDASDDDLVRRLAGPDVPGDLLQLYQRDLGRYPLLTAQDEAVELGRPPTTVELAAATELDCDEVDELLGYDRVPWSLDQPIPATDEEVPDADWDGERWVVPLGSVIADEDAEEDVVEYVFVKDRAEAVHQVLDTLTEREAGVIAMRFGLTDGDERTLEDIGRIYGVTRERIRQVQVKAMEKLHGPGRSDFLRSYLDPSGPRDLARSHRTPSLDEPDDHLGTPSP